MSEGAAKIKLFFLPSIALKLPLRIHYKRSERKDRALQGCNLSADSGAKTRLGLGETLSPRFHALFSNSLESSFRRFDLGFQKIHRRQLLLHGFACPVASELRRRTDPHPAPVLL